MAELTWEGMGFFHTLGGFFNARFFQAPFSRFFFLTWASSQSAERLSIKYKEVVCHGRYFFLLMLDEGMPLPAADAGKSFRKRRGVSYPLVSVDDRLCRLVERLDELTDCGIVD
jgi:hypothetical protein